MYGFFDIVMFIFNTTDHPVTISDIRVMNRISFLHQNIKAHTPYAHSSNLGSQFGGQLCSYEGVCLILAIINVLKVIISKSLTHRPVMFKQSIRRACNVTNGDWAKKSCHIRFLLLRAITALKS